MRLNEWLRTARLAVAVFFVFPARPAVERPTAPRGAERAASPERYSPGRAPPGVALRRPPRPKGPSHGEEEQAHHAPRDARAARRLPQRPAHRRGGGADLP